MLDSTIQRYTIQDIKTIETMCLRVPVRASVLTAIQDIYNEVCNSPRSVVHKSKESHRTPTTSFKTTRMTSHTGMDLSIDTLRKLLNMCTDTTYESLYPKLIEEFNVIQGENYNLEELDKLNHILFDILSGVMAYSKLYAMLYSTLYHTYTFLHGTPSRRVALFRGSILNIQYHDSTHAYDQYCTNNNENLKRRNTGAFLVHLIPHGIVKVVEINQILLFIQDEIRKRISMPNQTEIVDELTELESILYLTEHKWIRLTDECDEIQYNIQRIASFKMKEYISLSAKSIFQHMDMIEGAMSL